jgi:hypothetical protein
LLRRLDPSIPTASPFRLSSPFRGFTVPEGRTSRLPRIVAVEPLVPRNTKSAPCRPAQGRRPEGMTDLHREWLWDLVARENLDHGQRKKGGLTALDWVRSSAQGRGARSTLSSTRHPAAERKVSSDGPMDRCPAIYFLRIAPDGSIVSKHWRRDQRDARRGRASRTQFGLFVASRWTTDVVV